MVGFRWVGCWALLALSCGRTADSDHNAASAGAPPAAGGTGSGGSAMTSGTGPVTGQAGEPEQPECAVTPVVGQWVALGPDPYGFEFWSDESQLSGRGCLGALPSQGNAIDCSPLSLLADRGRRVAFVWDMNEGKEAVGLGYVVKMELTLSPERTAMAGKVWTSLGGGDGDGRDIVVVRYPDQPVPPATECSGGEPSGACFLGPLRSDRIDDLRVVQLGGGDLLLLWQNRRGIGRRVGSARFDAASGAWQDAEFLDDGSAPVDFWRLVASPGGWAMLTYRQNTALVSRSYDPELNTWSEQQELVVNDGSSPLPETLLVYDGGDATLIASNADSTALSAHDYVAMTRTWKAPHPIVATPDVSPRQWAAASDASRNELVVWADGDLIGEPQHVWFSSRSAAGTWSAPALFHTSDKQIIAPAAAVGPDGTAVVTWQEFTGRIASSSYSFASNAWSAPLTVTADEQIDNRTVTFNEAGVPVAYFHRNNVVNADTEQKTELSNGAWSAPQTTTAGETRGDDYAITGELDALQITPLHPSAAETPPPPYSRAGCKGYPATTVLFTNDDGRDVTLPLQQAVELTLQTIGPGQYGDPIISSSTVTFEGTARPRNVIPAGPTQIYHFRTIADGEATITIPHTGERAPFTLTLRCCAE